MFHPKKPSDRKDRVRRQAGQVLIESIVSISLITVGLLGVLSLLSNSIAYNRGVTNKFIATYLAAEGIEVVKNIEDANFGDRLTDNTVAWNRYLDTNGSYELQYDSVPSLASGLVNIGDLTVYSSRPLLFNPSTGIYSYDSGQTTGFTRTVRVSNLNFDEIQVNSIVQWTENGSAKQINVEDHFFYWRTY